MPLFRPHRLLMLCTALATALCSPTLLLSDATAADTHGTAAASPDARARSVTTSLRIRAKVSSSVRPRARAAVEASPDHPAGTMLVKTSSGRVLAKTKVDRDARTSVALRLDRLRPGQHRLRAVFRAADGTGRWRSQASRVQSVPGCAWRPHVCGYPDATNTGVTVGESKLRTINDNVDLRTDGEVFKNAIVHGHLNIWADDVTVRNVRIINTGEDWGLGLIHSTNATITDTEILPDGPRLLVGIKDVYGDARGTRIRRTEIARTTTGIQTHEGLIADSYIHALAEQPGDHVNGTTSNGSTVPMTIRHNTIFNPHGQTDAISLFQDFGLEANRTITDNLLAGGGYTIYAGGQGTHGTTHHIVITDNRISRKYFPHGGSYGPVAKWEDGTGNQWSGNVWDDSGERIAER